ncbi:hypothetical protein BN1013_02461 [Candidatus Rubidus massiliensis]|nr:hypothetical protein BN1013_02461 [Candidatus Rubidus massiliensis]
MTCVATPNNMLVYKGNFEDFTGPLWLHFSDISNFEIAGKVCKAACLRVITATERRAMPDYLIKAIKTDSICLAKVESGIYKTVFLSKTWAELISKSGATKVMLVNSDGDGLRLLEDIKMNVYTLDSYQSLMQSFLKN